MTKDYFPPIAELRVVQRANRHTDQNGIAVITILSECLEFRRQNESSWQRCDVVLEVNDDHERKTSGSDVSGHI